MEYPDLKRKSMLYSGFFLVAKTENLRTIFSHHAIIVRGFAESKAGNLSDSELLDLVQEFPTSSTETGNLGRAIENLIDSKLNTLKTKNGRRRSN